MIESDPMSRTKKVFLTSLTSLIAPYLLMVIGNAYWMNVLEGQDSVVWYLFYWLPTPLGSLAVVALWVVGFALIAGLITFWVWIILRIWSKNKRNPEAR